MEWEGLFFDAPNHVPVWFDPRWVRTRLRNAGFGLFFCIFELSGLFCFVLVYFFASFEQAEISIR